MLALVAAAGVLATWALFVLTGPGQAIDDMAYRGSTIGRARLSEGAVSVLDVVSVGSMAVAVAVLVVLAALRRSLLLALACVVLVAGANVTTQLLKHVLLQRPALGLGDENTLPSGHTTAATTLAVALVLVVPPVLRGVTGLLAAGYAVATGVSTIVAGWHRPSDVVAALCVVTAWTAALLAVPVIRAAVTGRRPAGPALRRARDLLLAAGAVGLVASVAALAVVVLAGGVADAEVSAYAAVEGAGRTLRLLAYAGGVVGSAAVGALAFGAVLGLLRHGPQRA